MQAQGSILAESPPQLISDRVGFQIQVLVFKNMFLAEHLKVERLSQHEF